MRKNYTRDFCDPHTEINGGLGRRYDAVCLQIVVRAMFRVGFIDPDNADLNDVKRWTQGVRKALQWPSDLDLTNVGAVREAMQAIKRHEKPGRLKYPRRGTLYKNIDQVGHLLGLDQDAKDLVHLLVIIQQHDFLGQMLCNSGQVNLAGAIRHLSRLTGASKECMEDLIAETSSPLRQTLLEVTNEIGPIHNKVRLAPWLGFRLRRDPSKPTDILAGQLSEPDATRLTPDDFPHLKNDLSIMSGYLAEARRSGRKGVNLLLYGPPGTGKTEFAKVLARKVGARLLEESEVDASREPKQRFRLILVAQRLLAQSGDSVVLIDEADDLIRAMVVPGTDGATISRMSVIRLLEQTPTPCIWITNHHRVFEPALLRRFDYVVEMKSPPRSIRNRLVERYLGELTLPTGWKEHLVNQENLTPANLERAARVACLAGPALGSKQQTGIAAVRALDNTLKAMGCRTCPQAVPESVPYRPELINADADLVQLAESLGRGGNARLCLYGPPGTGKTAFAHHLAKTLDRPLHARRASDLLSRWVGGTEERIAEAFAAATDDQAILLIDEADTFLRDRTRAERSWEVSQVNELLVQMETFAGTFIASTNLIDDLDQASLRRFDFKVAFRAMRPNQVRLMLDDLALLQGLTVDQVTAEHIQAIPGLTPGDFANVARQARLVPLDSGEDLIHRLTAELDARSVPAGRIGFV